MNNKPAPNPLLWRILGVLLCLISAASCFYLKYVAAVLLPLALTVLVAQGWRRVRPFLRRFAAACILAVCHPRKNHEPKLHAFCYPDHA